MAGYTLSALEADIRSYTEVSSTVLTGAILSRFIENSEFRIFNDVPSDNNRFVSEGSLATDTNNINVPGLGTKGNTGTSKYYAMFGGATGTSSTTSGALYLAPTPDAAYMHRIYYDMVPKSLVTKTSGTYVSQYFPQGLLYATLVEAYGFLKGPMDMLTLYENKYKQEVSKFAGVQIGRRRRDDYTDGTVRIPIKSPNP
jgi:hypothetical protein